MWNRGPLPKKRNNAALWSHVWPIDVWTGILTELDPPYAEWKPDCRTGMYSPMKWPTVCRVNSNCLVWGVHLLAIQSQGLSILARRCRNNGRAFHAAIEARECAAWKLWMMRNDETFMTFSTIYCWSWRSCPMHGLKCSLTARKFHGTGIFTWHRYTFRSTLQAGFQSPPWWHEAVFLAAVLLALPMLTPGAGFKYVLFTLFSPQSLGKFAPIWRSHIFSNGWEKTTN